jgi:hypothetical protein
MDILNTYTYKNKDFYILDELKSYDSKFFYGCAQMGPEKIINKKSITDYEVVKYTKNKDGEYEWSESTLKYKRCKLFVSVEWAGLNIPKLCGRMEGYKYPDAPPILELTDKECFKDKDGYILPVEVRGERNENKVYFKAKDIGRIFEMENLCRTIYNKHNGYQQSEDYVIFSNCTRLTTGTPSENKTKPSIFLTYNGLLKVVFLSRSGIAKEFRSWATKVVYTAHIGTTEQREHIAKQIKGGADPESVKNVLRCSVTSTPCIYLFCLGGVKDLRENEIFREVLSSKNFKNSEKVYKYGRSIDLCRRTGEHRRSWAPLEIKLSKYVYIDHRYTSKVELDLKNYLSEELECQFLKVNGPDGQATNEIVVLSNQQLKLLSDKYVDLSKEYGGCLTDITKTNIELERRLETLTLSHDSEMEKLQHKIELNQTKYQLELEKERSKSTSLEKEIEILKLKMELLSFSK